MPLQGDLKEFGIPEIFQLLEQQSKNGCLKIRTETGGIEVYFQEGRIVGALSGGRSPAEQLLDALETLGFLSAEEVGKIQDQQEKDLRGLPEILRQRGVVEYREFDLLLREQIEEILFPVFQKRKGTFSFVQDKMLSSEWVLSEPLPVEPIILEGLRQTDEWPMLKKRIGSFQEVPQRQLIFGGERSRAWMQWMRGLWKRRKGAEEGDDPEMSALGLLPDEEPSLSSAEKVVYSLVDGKHSVGEILSASSLGEYSAGRAFLSLLNRGWIRFDRTADQVRREKKEAGARKGGLIKGTLILAGLIFLVLYIHYVTSPRQISWIQEPFQEGLVPVFRLLNNQQRERVLQAVDVYRQENGGDPTRLSDLVQKNLLRKEDLSLWGSNRFSYQVDPRTGYRLLIVPSQP